MSNPVNTTANPPAAVTAEPATAVVAIAAPQASGAANQKDNKAQEAADAAKKKALGAAVATATKALADAEADLKANPSDATKKAAVEKAKTSLNAATKAAGSTSGGGFFENFDIGRLLSMIGIGGGAYFMVRSIVSGILGDGLFGTIISAMIAIPLGLMGGNQFGDKLNEWMGRPTSKGTKVAEVPPRTQAAEIEPQQRSFTSEELNAMLGSAKAKGHRTNALQVHAAQGKPWTLSTIPEGVNAEGIVAITQAEIPAKLAACSVSACDLGVVPAAGGGYTFGAVPKAHAQR